MDLTYMHLGNALACLHWVWLACLLSVVLVRCLRQQLNIGMCAIDAYQSALTIGQTLDSKSLMNSGRSVFNSLLGLYFH